MVFTVTAGMILLVSISGCGRITRSLDVVANESVRSFEVVLDTLRVEADEANAGWSLTAPDGDARFIWSEDYSKSPLYDVMLELDAQPFLNAGLDADKLPEEVMLVDGMLIVGTKLGDDVLQYKGTPTPLSSYEQIVDQYRDNIGYHAPMDHYGVDLGGGNMFEWAKDMNTNDKDVVFVLNPEPFINAGVDPDAVEGWLFASVPVMDEEGKEMQMDKILKVFDLK